MRVENIVRDGDVVYFNVHGIKHSSINLKITIPDYDLISNKKDMLERIEKLENESTGDSLLFKDVLNRIKDLEWAVNHSIPDTFATSLDLKNLLTKDDIKAIKQASDVYKRYMDTARVDEIKEVYKEPEKKEVIRKCCFPNLCGASYIKDEVKMCGNQIGHCKCLVEETV